MNLHEAAEIVRNKATCNGTTDGILKVGEAYKMLWDTMLSELDPTLITKEWFGENEWAVSESRTWTKHGVAVWLVDNDNPYWVFWNRYERARIKTLGELRTLLRLMGGGD